MRRIIKGKRIVRGTALGLAASMLIGNVAELNAYAAGTAASAATETSAATAETAADNTAEAAAASADNKATTGETTVNDTNAAAGGESADTASADTDSKKAAADVEEKLYINMDYNGSINKANVVKGVQFTVDDSYTDHGDYTEIINMSDNQQPAVNGNAVTWKRPDGNGRFYFQGGLDKSKVKMPWDFTVTYKVNGVVTAPEKVAGASGTVEIDIDAIPNDNVSEYMKNNMVLMVLIPMDSSKVYSTDAPESMSASYGNYSGVGFEALPGQEKHFEARFGTDSFESMGVMMIMTPITAGDLSKVKDLKELEDKFRDKTNAVMDSVDAVLDNVSDMSSQLAKTNQMLDQLANGKAKIDQNKTIIFDGVDLTLQDVRDLTSLLDPLDSSLKTTQWMVYDINQNLNDTNAHLASTSAVMSTLSKKLRALSGEMESTNTFDISSITGDLTSTKANLNELKANLIKSGTAVSNIKTITGSDEYKNASSNVVTESAIVDTNIEGSYLPQPVIAYLNSVIEQMGSSAVTEDSLKALIPDIALLLDIYDILADPSQTGKVQYAATTSDLKTMAGALRTGDMSTIGTALTAYAMKYSVEEADIAQMQSRLLAIAGGASDESTNIAQQFVDHMISMLDLKQSASDIGSISATGATTNLKQSIDDLSEYGTDALANAITAYASVDYDTALDQINTVMSDIDDVMDAGAHVSYQTSRLLDSMRKVTSDVDNLIATLNSYYDDVQTAITNVSNLVEETEKTSDDLTRTAQVLNDTLRSASDDFSAAGDTGIAVGREAVDNTEKMIENTRNMKEAGSDLRKSINDKLDEEEEDNNFINMDPDATMESFTSSENVEPSSIAIICRTDEIKIPDEPDAMPDAEYAEEPTTFGQRVANVFKSLWNKILSIFGKGE